MPISLVWVWQNFYLFVTNKKNNNSDMKVKMNWLHYAEEMIAKL